MDHRRFRTEGDAAADRALLAAHGITAPYIGFVGTLEPRKDVPTLVAAFAPLTHDHPDLRLALVGGDGWGVDQIRTAITNSGAATHIVRTGYVDDDVVPALYRQAQAVVYPSFEEGFGVPALEALACGAPLVTTAGSALAEVVGDAARIVPVHDEVALAAALREVVEDHAVAAALTPTRAAAGTPVHLGALDRAAPRGLRARRDASRRVKAFITGANGFAGPHLVAHLRACGDDVVASDRSGSAPLDITDRDAVHETIAKVRPEVVYHLAAFTHVGQSFSAPERVLRVNIDGTVNVLDASRAADVHRVVVVGSAEEYGLVAPEDLPLREDAPLRPVSPYAASKVAASYLALQAWLGGGLETIRVRAFNHTGPGQSPNFLIPALAHRIAAAERAGTDEITIGSLEPVRDLNDVRDVVRAYRLLAEHGDPGEVYNVCSGRGVSVAEIAGELLSHARRELRLVQDPDLVRPVDIPRLVGDPTKIHAATGWQPEYTLHQTLGDVLAAA